MLLVYTTYITPRVTYVFNFVLDELCGFDFKITTNREEYIKHSGAALNYSQTALRSDDVQITPNGILEAEAIINCNATIIEQDAQKLLILEAATFKNHFDVFGAIFYLITRYEEYLVSEPDEHGRFKPENSILYKHGLLKTALVDNWGTGLKQQLLTRYPFLKSKKKSSTSIVTIDVDQTYAFKYRGFGRNVLSLLKNLASLNIPFLISQAETIVFRKKDPFDTFGYLRIMQEKSKLQFIYFINVGEYSRFDKNLPITNEHQKSLLELLKTYAVVGLHPSYYSNNKPELFNKEKLALSAALGYDVEESRQHYLKMIMPQTYRNLINAGIKRDYSMGYAGHAGFRAGTCTPFYWFDLSANQITDLRVFPITFMDGSLVQSGLQPYDALAQIKELKNEVQKHDGCFLSIWHNHTVNDRFSWKGWKAVFEESLKYICRCSCHIQRK